LPSAVRASDEGPVAEGRESLTYTTRKAIAMQLSSDRILTTHAGSLPRPDDLAEMLYRVADGDEVDSALLAQRVREAVADAVARQRAVGVDVVSDGEMGKVGFSTYATQRWGGFATAVEAAFLPADLVEIPAARSAALPGDGVAHMHIPVLEQPLTVRDSSAIADEIDDLLAALDGASPDTAFVSAITPGHFVWQFPNRYYASDEEYLEAAATALRDEYRAIVNAGFNLQLDSPNAAMAHHCVLALPDSASPTPVRDPLRDLYRDTEALNATLDGLAPEQIRLHVCWGNYGGPHHHDVELRQIIDPILQTNAGFISFEAANPRHAHEWRIWEDVKLPDDKALIPGVIDTNTQRVEHPMLVAERIERFAELVGRERVIAGTDCGFATFAGVNVCPPEVAWLKLGSLVEGAALASRHLW
jgi:5-methyltetrahydropteroyltriglutamate--homocysteine methyltransferase